MAKLGGAWGHQTTRSFTPEVDCLKTSDNAASVLTIVFDAGSVTPDPVTGERKVVAGTPVCKVGNQYRQFTDPVTQDVAGILAEGITFVDGSSKSDKETGMWCHGQFFRADRIVNWATQQADIRAGLPTCKFG